MRQGLPTLYDRQFVLLVSGHFLQALGYASMLLLPLYLTHLGASRGEVGQVMGTAAISGLLLRPAVAWSLDTWGRKPMLTVGTLVLASGLLVIGAVVEVGPLVYASRLLVGAGTGALFAGWFTLAADLLPAQRRTEALAVFGISGLLPIVVNPLVGRFGVEVAQLRFVFPVVALLIVSSLWFLRRLPEPGDPSGEPAAPLRLQDLREGLLRPALWPAWLMSITFSGLVATMFAFATVSAQSRGVAYPTDLWFAYAGGAVCVRLFGARLPDRIGPHNMIAPALCSFVAGFLVLAAASSAAEILLAGLLAGLAHGYCFPVLTSQIVTRAAERVRGSAMAIFTALWEVSALILPPLLGRVADRSGDAVMFALAASIGVVGLALWAALEHWLSAPQATRAPRPGAS